MGQQAFYNGGFLFFPAGLPRLLLEGLDSTALLLFFLP